MLFQFFMVLFSSIRFFSVLSILFDSFQFFSILFGYRNQKDHLWKSNIATVHETVPPYSPMGMIPFGFRGIEGFVGSEDMSQD